MNKFELVQSHLKSLSSDYQGKRPSLLDVGCRDCVLKRYVGDLADYKGVDLFQNPQGSVDYVLDVSKGLPLADRSFDIVVALDLVEHLDDFQGGLDELLRVTRCTLFVMLPNMAHALFRWRFLRKGDMGGKYELKFGQGQDRHRWLTVLPQADAYMSDFARARGVSLTTEWFNDSPKKRALAGACRAVGIGPAFWAWASLYALNRP